MRSVRAFLTLASLPLLAGCGYVHFGRMPAPGTAAGSDPTGKAHTDLAIEHKVLQQELALARKEGDALRAALDRGSSAAGGSPELVARLSESARELAMLRASYAKLQAERAGAPPADDAAARTRFSELEEKLAASLRTSTQLQEENARLRSDVDRTRGENLALAGQLKGAVALNDQAQAALAQLNTELLAQKEARVRAEQATAAVRAQLSTVLAQGPGAGRDSSSQAAGALQIAKAPPAGASATAELRTNPVRILAPSGTASLKPAEPARAPARIHVVQAGDTLETIARRYYNDPARWPAILDANSARLSAGGPLAPGTELQIP